ncbi:MAG: hypothetical protein WBA98_02380 [Gordonia sp. (in: high G+C Gram-positive bacteria)]|uniref:LGFP repeat-containing protein n=1 Tax=Gordonia sp. (in: high G+C Gram-positive bacteria) TaxID=84139 RepID=UPI003C72631C
MKQIVRKTAGVAAALALTASVAACTSTTTDTTEGTAATLTPSVSVSVPSVSVPGMDANKTVELTAADGTKVELKGPIAVKYEAATDKQKADLGKVLTGADASGTSDSGVVFQQFDGGVITAQPGKPAYITWGKIRDAWNVKRDSSGEPAADGKGGSNGPLGAATSDETEEGALKVSTFEHGKITFDQSADKVVVTVNDKVVATK